MSNLQPILNMIKTINSVMILKTNDEYTTSGMVPASLPKTSTSKMPQV